MEYKPSVKPFRFFLLFLGAISGLILLLAVRVQIWLVPSLIGIGWSAILAYVGRARVLITDEIFEYKGLVKHWSLRIEEITKMVRLQDQGWPKDRMYGKETWEFSTHNQKVRANLLMFVEARKEIQKLIKKGKRDSTLFKRSS